MHWAILATVKIDEINACLRARRTESMLLPLNASLAILSQMDQIRGPLAHRPLRSRI